MRERLAKGDTTEEGAYAKVLQAREQLRLAKLYFRTGSERLKAKQMQYAQAFFNCAKAVKVWKQEQPESDIDLYIQARREKFQAKDPFIWEGRLEVLTIPKEMSTQLLSTEISCLKGRIRAIDPSIIGESESFFGKFCRIFSLIFNSDWWNKASLVASYTSLTTREQELIASLEADPSTEPPPPPPTPQQQLIEFFEVNMQHFDERIKGFIETHLKVPEDSQIDINRNTLTIMLPEAISLGPIDSEKGISQLDFKILNRQFHAENLKYLTEVSIPEDEEPPSNPTLKDLTYFRSLGRRATEGLLGGAKISVGKKVKIKIEGATIKFLIGCPIVSGTFNVSIKAITLCPLLETSVADQELAKVKIESSMGFVSLPTSEYFLADLDRLLTLMQEKVAL